MEKKMGMMSPKIPKTSAAIYAEKNRHIKTKIDPISDDFIPEYKTEDAACCDVKANVGEGKITTLGYGETKKIPLGFRMQLPPGWECQIRARSGLASRAIIVTNGIGTIDSTFPSEICVLLTNLGKEVFEIKHGDRIAQMALKPVYYFDFEKSSDFIKTDRSGGFGSTGIT